MNLIFDKNEIETYMPGFNPERVGLESLWDKVCKQIGDGDDLKERRYTLLARAIELEDLLAESDEALRDYGFDLLKNLSPKSLHKAKISSLIAKRVLLKEAATLDWEYLNSIRQIFQDLGEVVWTRERAQWVTLSIATASMTELANGEWGEISIVTKFFHNAIEGVALKTYTIKHDVKKTKESQFEMNSEIECLTKLHSRITEEEKKKFIPEPIKVNFDGKEGYLTKLFPRDLYKCVRSFCLDDQQKNQVALQLAEQLAILARVGVIYTDIKLSNVLVDLSTTPLTVRLCDFGNCHFVDDPSTIPSYGFTFSPYSSCVVDGVDLSVCAKAAKFCKTESSKELLAKASQAHQSRALGLLLCQLYMDHQEPFFDDYYEMQELEDRLRGSVIYTNSKPVYKVMRQMLGLIQPQIMPQQAFEALKGLLI